MHFLRRTLPTLSHRSFSTTACPQVAKMSIIGRLAATPELTTTTSGRDLVRYAVGSSSGAAENRHTSWFRIGAFMQPSAFRELILRQEKGTLVAVEADGEMRTLEGSEEGSKRIVLNLRQRDFNVLARPQNRAEASEEVDSALAGQG